MPRENAVSSLSALRTRSLERYSAIKTGVVQRRRELHHYEDHTAFFFSKVSAASAALITFFLTLEPALLAAAIVMGAVLLLDIWNIRAHKKLVDGLSHNYRRWQFGYSSLSTIFMFSTGLWCFPVPLSDHRSLRAPALHIHHNGQPSQPDMQKLHQ